MTVLLNVDTALERILAQIEQVGAEEVDFSEALGRVLAVDVYANLNLPPFANSSMDGYAVRAADIVSTPVVLTVGMDITAGKVAERGLESGEAARIMTGAPMPEGADAVVPVEDTDGKWDSQGETPASEQVTIQKSVQAGAYVRSIGEDITEGQLILTAGTLLRPQEIGVLVGLGEAKVKVIRRPRVVILSTGDELLGVGEPLVPGKIHDMNSYVLAGLVTEYGGHALRLPIARDTLDEIRTLFKTALMQQPDMIISSAGVSVGAADFIRTVLAESGEVDFWRINLRPGKPLAFGQVQGIPFFGLPGNPVSAMVTFDVLVRPALLKQGGRNQDWSIAEAILTHDLQSDGRRSYIRVKLESKEGKLYATSTGTQSSGALTSMVMADGLLIIPEDLIDVKAGIALSVRLLHK